MQRITLYEREQIEMYLRMGKTHRWIGRRLRRDHTVVSREIKSHSGEALPYRAKTAHEIYERKIGLANRIKMEKNQKLKEYVENGLEMDWSPQQICNVLKKDPPKDLREITLCHETVYAYVYHHAEKNKHLYRHLRYKRKKRQERYGRKKRSEPIINKISIENRPKIINERKEYGHWETDLLMVGKYAICVSVERKSSLCRLRLLPDKKAISNEESIKELIETEPYDFVQSITRDNGGENALHDETRECLGVQSYFCHPYSAWEKGLVENTNGLIRQYYPKKSKGIVPTTAGIQLVENLLNNRPRKKNNYLTPNQIYENIHQVVQ